MFFAAARDTISRRFFNLYCDYYCFSQERFFMSVTPQEFYVIIERDEDGLFVGEVPQLKACYSQGETIDELMSNIKEVVELCLEEQDETSPLEFVGVHKLVI